MTPQQPSEQQRSYRVWLRSTPGFYAQYDGKVDVFAEDYDQAIERALQKWLVPSLTRCACKS